MVKPNKEKIKYYYRDEINDDFAKFQIVPEKLDENYKYVNKHKIYWFFSQMFRALVCWPILYPICKLAYHCKVENKKVFKQVKHQGYFLFSNHVTALDPVHHAVLTNPTAFTAIIASVETFSIKGLAGLIHYLGAMPVPGSPSMYRNFHDALKFHIASGHKVVVYPEAHIWPFYTGIRPFKSVSFRYPVELNAPIIVATTTFKKRKFSKRPKAIIHLDGPLYPNKELKFKEQIQDLRDRTYKIMSSHANKDDNYATYDYIKVVDEDN